MSCSIPLFSVGAPSNSAPPNAAQLPFYIDSSTNKMYFWSGTAWMPIVSTGTSNGGGTPTVVPLASPSTAGIIKVGTGLAIDANGKLDVTITGGNVTQAGVTYSNTIPTNPIVGQLWIHTNYNVPYSQMADIPPHSLAIYLSGVWHQVAPKPDLGSVTRLGSSSITISTAFGAAPTYTYYTDQATLFTFNPLFYLLFPLNSVSMNETSPSPHGTVTTVEYHNYYGGYAITGAASLSGTPLSIGGYLVSRPADLLGTLLVANSTK
jgi:hypothetical protein